MQSFLIISQTKEKGSSYILEFLKERKINSLDIDVQNFEKAMGIEDVRNLQKKILLRPFRGKEKAIIIQAFEGITNEAQNALLKVLEEPPLNTLIIISAPKKELFLPTIISRLNIIELTRENIDLTKDDILKFNNFLEILLKGSVGDKLKICEDISKNKVETILFLEKMSIFVRTKLIENYNDKEYLTLSKNIMETYKVIKTTNVNQRIAMENLLLLF